MNRISPSNINLWEGERETGARFTAGQIKWAGIVGLDLETCEAHTVDLNYSRGVGYPADIVRVECPIVIKTPTSLKILTPYGHAIWVKR